MPHGLLAPLRHLGHTAESVGTLRLKGLDNSRLYREVAQSYDLFLTKDREFASQVEVIRVGGSVKVGLAILAQQPEREFVAAFMEAFVATDWSASPDVGDWPSPALDLGH